MEKVLTCIILFKIIFKNYIFNSLLKTIIYFCKTYYYFLFLKIKNRIQIKLNNFISKEKCIIYQIIQLIKKI